MLKIKSFCFIILIIYFNFGNLQATTFKNVNSQENDENINTQNEDNKSVKASLSQIVKLFEKKFQVQNEELKELNENISKVQQQLLNYKSKDNGAEKETETETNTVLNDYDEHFNCLKNCTTRNTLPSSCHEAVLSYGGRNNVYLIQIPNSELPPFYVYCYFEAGSYAEIWTIIQRRTDGSVNFFRNWYEYKYGFGNLYNEYWIGLERIHQMTKNKKHELWIILENFDGERRFARYTDFYISDEANKYQLYVDGFFGNAKDSLSYTNNSQFSTFDNSNDPHFINCAVEKKSGWWHRWCTEANLNGPYYTMSNRRTSNGIFWYGWTLFRDSLKYVHMAIRAVE